MKQRTPAYWPTRIMLAVGVTATMLVVALALVLLTQDTPFAPMFGPELMVIGVPARVVGVALGVGVAVLGLAWMLRIFFRGRRGDEPPAWRYRRRR